MARRDEGLDRLIDLDGFLAEVGGGYWVKIDARRVPAEPARLHGVMYALTLHESGGRRVFGIDNAHVVRQTSGPAGRSTVQRDHVHRGTTIRPYVYRDADTLMEDFWREVEVMLKKAGVSS